MRLLKKPVITEKSISNTKQRFFTFAVDLKATKDQIRKMIEKHYQVDVLTIKTVKMPQKSRKSAKSGKKVNTSPWKKAIVQIGKDQKIPIFEVGS